MPSKNEYLGDPVKKANKEKRDAELYKSFVNRYDRNVIMTARAWKICTNQVRRIVKRMETACSPSA